MLSDTRSRVAEKFQSPIANTKSRVINKHMGDRNWRFS